MMKPFSYSLLCFFILFLDKVVVTQNTNIPVNVGVVLDLDSLVGKIGLTCINMSLSDFYAAHGDYKTRLVLNTRDSNEDVVGAAAAGPFSLFSSSLSIYTLLIQLILCINIARLISMLSFNFIVNIFF